MFKCLNSSQGMGSVGEAVKKFGKEHIFLGFFLEVKWFLTIELTIPLRSRPTSLGGAVGVGGEG